MDLLTATNFEMALQGRVDDVEEGATPFHDVLNNNIAKLTQTKAEVEASIESDLAHAKECYMSSQRTGALEAMRRVHRNKIYKDCIATALFHLIAIRIETQWVTGSMSSFEEEAISDFSISWEQQQMFEGILANLEAFECSVPEDKFLMRKVARLCGGSKDPQYAK